MRTFLLASVAASVVACSRGPSRSESPSVANQAQQATAPAATDGYPPGRWRLARPDVVYPALIRLSHILIRHEGVQPGIVSFQLPNWTPSPAAPTRTVAEARALAQHISERLRKNPSEFAAVSRELSEDVATRDAGGGLGVRTAADFLLAPEVLDAAAALKPGEVSRVVETQYGFHVFQKLAPPAEQTVSGVRILIAHDDAPWLRTFLSRGPVPARSREEALKIADSLYRRAKAGEAIAELARRYSEHREAARGGDFGAWSTREPSPFPRELEILSGLAVGDIYPPIDTPFGIAVMQRVANRPRQSFAMAVIQQRFTATAAPGDAAAREQVLKNVREIGLRIAGDPQKFAELEEQYPADRREQWIEGRGEAEAELMLSHLRPGEVGTEPVQLASAFGIVQRLEPVATNAPQYSFELPAPAQPDFEYFAASGRLHPLMPDLAKACERDLGLPPSSAREFRTVLDGVVNLSGPPDDPKTQSAYSDLEQRMKTLLGPEKFARYLGLLATQIEKKVLSTKSSPEKRIVRGMPLAARD